MQGDLQGLTRELRKETCPRRVIEAARSRIAAETRSPVLHWLRYAMFATLVASLVLCGLIAKWRLSERNLRTQFPLVAQQKTTGRVETARQAETALVLIGAVLRDASTHSETVISETAIPTLRNGFQNAKNKIVRHTEL